MRRTLEHFAKRLTEWCSTPWALVVSIALVLAWVAYGVAIRSFGSDWQFPINTVTTIVTFITGFAILVAGAISTKAIFAKLDEIIRVIDKADDRLIGLEDQDEQVIDQLKEEKAT